MTQEKPRFRLYVTDALRPGETILLSEGQSHYAAGVMRAKTGETVALFNGMDGEWEAEIAVIAKKRVTVRLKEQRRRQQASPDLWLAFAPIKNKTDLVVEKATELGISKLLPVFMRHSVVRSVNMEKLMAHAVEAAEQCERLDVPAIETVEDIPTLLASWPPERLLLYGDESGEGEPLKKILNSLPPCGGGLGRGVSLGSPPPAAGAATSPIEGEVKQYAVLVGPEGGFSGEEHRLLRAAPFVKPFTMGPRILRADTAAAAAIACVQAWLGDWQEKPNFMAGA